MADDSDRWRAPDEPSTEEFEAAEQEAPLAGAGSVVFRILRVAGVLLLIIALLLYFVVPFRDVVIGVLRELQIPLQSIPLAPAPVGHPTLPA